LKQQLHTKEQANLLQIKETDALRQELKETKAILTRLYYRATKVIGIVKEVDDDAATKLGKEMTTVRSRYLRLPQRK
jgi:hypothetical protein